MDGLLPPNTATPLALFVGSGRTEIHSSSVRINKDVNDIFFSEQSYPGLVFRDNRDSKDSVLQTCWMFFIVILYSYL